MNFYKTYKKYLSILVVIVLLIGLFVIIALVQKQQNIRSKATSPDAYNALHVTDTSGNSLPYKDENGVRTYDTQSLNVRIKVNDLEKLTGNGQ